MKNNGQIRMSAPNRIMHLVATRSPTSIGLLSLDSGLQIETVRKHVNALIAEGRLEYGADGNQIQFTITELEERAWHKRASNWRR